MGFVSAFASFLFVSVIELMPMTGLEAAAVAFCFFFMFFFCVLESFTVKLSASEAALLRTPTEAEL